MPQPVEPITAVSLASLAVLCALGLRKLILMDGLLKLRAVALTLLLWAVLLGLLIAACQPPSTCCVDDCLMTDARAPRSRLPRVSL
jgi:hypothetical protein